MMLARLKFLFYLIPAIFYFVRTTDPVHYGYILEQASFPGIQLVVSVILLGVLLLIRVRLYTASSVYQSQADNPIELKDQPNLTGKRPSDHMLPVLIYIAVFLFILLLLVINFQ